MASMAKTKTFKNLSKKVYILAFLFALGMGAFADRVGLNGYQDLTIDFPESFAVLSMSTDGKKIQLANQEHPVSALITLSNYGKYGSTQRAMDDIVSQLKLKASSKTVEWRNQKSTFAELSGSLNGSEIFGYAATFTLPYDKGTFFFMTWCSKSDSKKYECLLASLMDSICIDAGSYYESGIYTAWKYPYAGELTDITLNIDSKTISTKLRKNDQKIAAATIDREYSVLCLYQKSAAWKEAWQRYYRMIFKDSYKRLRIAAFDIYNALSPDCQDETALAQKLLSWTQTFTYEREKASSDFADLPSILMGGGSDCDSRSMLLAVLLTHMNQDAVIFVSAQYSHAMAGFVSSHPGHSFTVNNKKYLMGETTSLGLTWGKISSDMDNQSAWITVSFP